MIYYLWHRYHDMKMPDEGVWPFIGGAVDSTIVAAVAYAAFRLFA